ncbi:hypothetical protein BI347_03500 [Chromobacterium sphagni]|uniref:O-antigen ligase-related domain-containing protein n=2 Tax=Chromobacterium sphagni TaxID=1903179 RepID=A0A1S1WZH0_9NEIS|nr:hypothetical protein BI347_03500 [Chromobacterium sphagni]
MCAIGLAIVTRQLVDLDFRMRFADSATRLMIAIPIFVALIHTNFVNFKTMRWALFAAIFLMLIFGYYHAVVAGDPRIRTEFTNTIPYSAFCLIFGVAFFICSYRLGGWDRVAAIIAIFGSYLALYLSQSRGVWVAGAVVSLFLLSSVFGFSRKKFFIFLFVLIAALVSAYFFSEVIRDRVVMAVSECHQFFMGQRHGSIGERLDMALVSYYIFKAYPLFGVGRDISPVLHMLHEQGLVIASVVNATDTHGELFFNAASLGVVGLLCYCAFYIGGSYPFWKAAFSQEPEAVALGKVGLASSMILFIVGFTHITLGLVMYASIYATFQGLLLSSLYKLQQMKASR